MTISKTTEANRTYGTIVLRGGRLTKWKGKAASLSPSLGQLIASVSPVALGRALMVGASKTATAAVLGGAGLIVTTSGASADCSPSGAGVYTCSSDATTTQTLTGSGSLLDVTIVDPATSFDTSGTVGADAFKLTSNAGITFEDETDGATITGGHDGINAEITGATGGISITTTGTTTGGDYGINVYNHGTGAVNITTTGTTIGTTGNGIFAKIYGTDLTINAATTTGATDGINAINSGTGALNITTSGAITGGTGYGIRTITAANKTSNITLNSGTVVSSTAGLGIYNNEGNSITTVNSGASVAGKIALGKGIDILVLAGGDLSGVTQFDGGGGILDILKFSGFSGSINSARISNWESVEINKGSTIAFSNKALTINTLGINTGGTLNAVSGTFALTGNMSNSGTVNMADGDTGDKVTVSGNFSGSGQVNIDVDTKANTSDQLAIAGNSTGTTKLAFTNLTPGEETGVTIQDVVTVAGTSSATDFSLKGVSIVGNIYTYTLQYDAGSFNLVGALNSTVEVISATVIESGSTTSFSSNKRNGDLTINTGGTLNAVSGTFALTGNMSNSGTVNMADGDTGDKVTVSGNFSGSGAINIDVDTKANTSDQLAIVWP